MQPLENADSVTAYISKCFDDVVLRVNVRTFPNQKPWVNGGVGAKLKTWSSAYSSVDLEALRSSKHDPFNPSICIPSQQIYG